MFLIDTNVLSEFRKAGSGRIDPAVQSWADSVRAEDTFVSVMSVLELERGVLLKQRQDSDQARILSHWMNSRLLPHFAGRILAVDEAVARRTAGLHVPQLRPHADALIAGTALIHGLIVVTRNVRDFEPTGVSLLNPWDWVQEPKEAN